MGDEEDCTTIGHAVDREGQYRRSDEFAKDVRKTYFLTDTLTTKLPQDFINSEHKKYIEIQNVKFFDFNRNIYPKDVDMHVGFLHERDYLDKTVVPVNHRQANYKTFQFKGNEEELTLWFTQDKNSQPVVEEPFPITPFDVFEDFDFRNTPDYEELYRLMLWVNNQFQRDMVLDYNLSTRTFTDARYNSVVNAIRSFQATSPYYANAMLPLIADQAFYTNDYLFNFMQQIYQWADDLVNVSHIETPILEAFVLFFKASFVPFLEYDWDPDYYPDVKFDNVGIMLASYIFDRVQTPIEDYLFDVLDNSDMLDFASDADQNKAVDPGLFLHFMHLWEEQYDTPFKASGFEAFKATYTMIGNRITKDNIVAVQKLATDIYNIPDFMPDTIAELMDGVHLNPHLYDLDFGARFNNESRSYLFLQLYALMQGGKQEPLQWSPLREEYVGNGISIVYQIARDNLTRGTLQREVIYGDNVPRITSRPSLVNYPFKEINTYLSDWFEKNLVEFHNYLNITNELASTFVSDYESIQKGEYPFFASKEDLQIDYDVLRRTVVKNDKIAIEYRDVIDSVMDAISEEFDNGTVQNGFFIYESYILSLYLEEELEGKAYDKSYCDTITNLYNDFTDGSVFMQYMNHDPSEVSLLKYQLFMVYHCIHDVFSEPISLNTMLLEYNDALTCINRVDDLANSFLTFIKWYFVRYGIDVDIRRIDCESITRIWMFFFPAEQAFRHAYTIPQLENLFNELFGAISRHQDISTVADKIGLGLRYHLNFDEPNYELRNEIIIQQYINLLLDLALAQTADEHVVWVEIDRDIDEHHELITEEAIDSLVPTIHFIHTIMVPDNGIPPEQYYFDSITGDQKYNYRFLAEFMLIF